MQLLYAEWKVFLPALDMTTDGEKSPIAAHLVFVSLSAYYLFCWCSNTQHWHQKTDCYIVLGHLSLISNSCTQSAGQGYEAVLRETRGCLCALAARQPKLEYLSIYFHFYLPCSSGSGLVWKRTLPLKSDSNGSKTWLSWPCVKCNCFSSAIYDEFFPQCKTLV